MKPFLKNHSELENRLLSQSKQISVAKNLLGYHHYFVNRMYKSNFLTDLASGKDQVTESFVGQKRQSVMLTSSAVPNQL